MSEIEIGNYKGYKFTVRSSKYYRGFFVTAVNFDTVTVYEESYTPLFLPITSGHIQKMVDKIKANIDGGQEQNLKELLKGVKV